MPCSYTSRQTCGQWQVHGLLSVCNVRHWVNDSKVIKFFSRKVIDRYACRVSAWTNRYNLNRVTATATRCPIHSLYIGRQSGRLHVAVVEDKGEYIGGKGWFSRIMLSMLSPNAQL